MAASLPASSDFRSPTRRAVLAGALGGIGALAAAAIGRATPVRAHDPQDVLLGGFNSTTGSTQIDSTATAAAIVGESHDSTAVQGYSGTSSLPPAPAKTGVYGYAAQDSSARGVIGESTSGIGIHGIATSGYAGYFAGKLYTSRFLEMTEISAPAKPTANKGRLFLRDVGSGTELCVRFDNGVIRKIATAY
jgi:hypothetical protein